MNNVIHTRLIKIGNSQGIRIPKAILDQIGLTDAIDLEVHDNHLVVRTSKTPRTNWSTQFQQMAINGDDQLLDENRQTNWDESEWQWE